MTDESYPAIPDRLTENRVTEPDFTVTVVANLDPSRGPVAEGAMPGPVVESDYPHVRTWVLGMILQIRGALPIGWDITVEVLHETGTQHETGWQVLDNPIDTEAHDV